MLNSVLTPLSLYVDAKKQASGGVSYSVDDLRAISSLNHGSPHFGALQERLSQSMELYFRTMISNSAFKFKIAYEPSDDWLDREDIVKLLSPTAAKSIEFVDKKSWYWNPLYEYMRPILFDAKGKKLEVMTSGILWDVYLFVLSSKHCAEVTLRPAYVVNKLNRLMASGYFRPESLARLSFIKGIFNCYSEPSEVSALKFLPTAIDHRLGERIDEILEDGYLLEASRLRRLIGIRENVAGLNRGLKKILEHVSTRRGWAKGLFAVGKMSFHGGASSFEAIEKFGTAVPELVLAGNAPVLLRSDVSRIGGTKACLRVVRFPLENKVQMDV